MYSRHTVSPCLHGAPVSCIHGEGRICGVTIRQLDSGVERFQPCDTLVTALGMVPERELLRPLGEPLPTWVFLCGNCLEHPPDGGHGEPAGDGDRSGSCRVGPAVRGSWLTNPGHKISI